MRILRYLKGRSYRFIVFVALIVQAFVSCHPSYTSDIVDMVYSRRASATLFRWINPDTHKLRLLMTDDEISLVNSAYALNEDAYELTAFGKDRIEIERCL